MVGSLTDAPGGAIEEFEEVMVSYGMEYWYKNKYALRCGNFWESHDKGDRKYFTMRLGLKLKTFGLDVAYLVPQHITHPLSQTYRFTLLFNFNNSKSTEY